MMVAFLAAAADNRDIAEFLQSVLDWFEGTPDVVKVVVSVAGVFMGIRQVRAVRRLSREAAERHEAAQSQRGEILYAINAQTHSQQDESDRARGRSSIRSSLVKASVLVALGVLVLIGRGEASLADLYDDSDALSDVVVADDQAETPTTSTASEENTARQPTASQAQWALQVVDTSSSPASKWEGALPIGNGTDLLFGFAANTSEPKTHALFDSWDGAAVAAIGSERQEAQFAFGGVAWGDEIWAFGKEGPKPGLWRWSGDGDWVAASFSSDPECATGVDGLVLHDAVVFNDTLVAVGRFGNWLSGSTAAVAVIDEPRSLICVATLPSSRSSSIARSVAIVNGSPLIAGSEAASGASSADRVLWRSEDGWQRISPGADADAAESVLLEIDRAADGGLLVAGKAAGDPQNSPIWHTDNLSAWAPAEIEWPAGAVAVTVHDIEVSGGTAIAVGSYCTDLDCRGSEFIAAWHEAPSGEWRSVVDTGMKGQMLQVLPREDETYLVVGAQGTSDEWQATLWRLAPFDR